MRSSSYPPRSCPAGLIGSTLSWRYLREELAMHIEFQYLLGAALLAAILLSVGALAGFCVGQRVAAASSQPVKAAPTPTRILAFDLDRCLADGHDIARQSASL